jgi:hypothetical protein
MHKLKLQGFLDEQSRPTAEAKLLLIEAAKLHLRKIKDVTTSLDESFQENIAKYRKLFPAGVVAGKQLRNSANDLVPRMVWFQKTYPQYTWENILSATEKYIQSLGTDYTYCKTAAYFIKKDDKNKSSISLLATWCEAELDDDNHVPVNIGFNRLV